MTEAERLARLAHEFSSRLGGAVKDMVPVEAQAHLLNAQRELITALFLIYEHQAAGRRAEPQPRRRSASGSAPRRRARSEPPLRKIDVE